MYRGTWYHFCELERACKSKLTGHDRHERWSIVRGVVKYFKALSRHSSNDFELHHECVSPFTRQLGKDAHAKEHSHSPNSRWKPLAEMSTSLVLLENQTLTTLTHVLLKVNLDQFYHYIDSLVLVPGSRSLQLIRYLARLTDPLWVAASLATAWYVVCVIFYFISQSTTEPLCTCFTLSGYVLSSRACHLNPSLHSSLSLSPLSYSLASVWYV